MAVRPALLPPVLDAARVDRLTDLADEVVRAIEAGRPTRDPIARFNADAGARLTQFDFHAAAGAGPTRDFVEDVLTPVPKLLDLTDREAAELVRRLQADEGTRRDQRYWVALLAKSLDQPGLSDLVHRPSQRLEPEELVRIARTCRGSALARNLDPRCRGYHVAWALLRRLVERRLVVLRPGTSLEALARGAEQFVHREHVSPRQIEALAAWLVAQPAVEEVFVDDAQLAQHLARV